METRLNWLGNDHERERHFVDLARPANLVSGGAENLVDGQCANEWPNINTSNCGSDGSYVARVCQNAKDQLGVSSCRQYDDQQFYNDGITSGEHKCKHVDKPLETGNSSHPLYSEWQRSTSRRVPLQPEDNNFNPAFGQLNHGPTFSCRARAPSSEQFLQASLNHNFSPEIDSSQNVLPRFYRTHPAILANLKLPRSQVSNSNIIPNENNKLYSFNEALGPELQIATHNISKINASIAGADHESRTETRTRLQNKTANSNRLYKNGYTHGGADFDYLADNNHHKSLSELVEMQKNVPTKSMISGRLQQNERPNFVRCRLQFKDESASTSAAETTTSASDLKLFNAGYYPIAATPQLQSLVDLGQRRSYVENRASVEEMASIMGASKQVVYGHGQPAMKHPSNEKSNSKLDNHLVGSFKSSQFYSWPFNSKEEEAEVAVEEVGVNGASRRHEAREQHQQSFRQTANISRKQQHANTITNSNFNTNNIMPTPVPIPTIQFGSLDSFMHLNPSLNANGTNANHLSEVIGNEQRLRKHSDWLSLKLEQLIDDELVWCSRVLWASLGVDITKFSNSNNKQISNPLQRDGLHYGPEARILNQLKARLIDRLRNYIECYLLTTATTVPTHIPRSCSDVNQNTERPPKLEPNERQESSQPALVGEPSLQLDACTESSLDDNLSNHFDILLYETIKCQHQQMCLTNVNSSINQLDPTQIIFPPDSSIHHNTPDQHSQHPVAKFQLNSLKLKLLDLIAEALEYKLRASSAHFMALNCARKKQESLGFCDINGHDSRLDEQIRILPQGTPTPTRLQTAPTNEPTDELRYHCCRCHDRLATAHHQSNSCQQAPMASATGIVNCQATRQGSIIDDARNFDVSMGYDDRDADDNQDQDDYVSRHGSNEDLKIMAEMMMLMSDYYDDPEDRILIVSSPSSTLSLSSLDPKSSSEHHNWAYPIQGWEPELDNIISTRKNKIIDCTKSSINANSIVDIVGVFEPGAKAHYNNDTASGHLGASNKQQSDYLQTSRFNSLPSTGWCRQYQEYQLQDLHQKQEHRPLHRGHSQHQDSSCNSLPNLNLVDVVSHRACPGSTSNDTVGPPEYLNVVGLKPGQLQEKPLLLLSKNNNPIDYSTVAGLAQSNHVGRAVYWPSDVVTTSESMLLRCPDRSERNVPPETNRDGQAYFGDVSLLPWPPTRYGATTLTNIMPVPAQHLTEQSSMSSEMAPDNNKNKNNNNIHNNFCNNSWLDLEQPPVAMYPAGESTVCANHSKFVELPASEGLNYHYEESQWSRNGVNSGAAAWYNRGLVSVSNPPMTFRQEVDDNRHGNNHQHNSRRPQIKFCLDDSMHQPTTLGGSDCSATMMQNEANFGTTTESNEFVPMKGLSEQPYNTAMRGASRVVDNDARDLNEELGQDIVHQGDEFDAGRDNKDEDCYYDDVCESDNDASEVADEDEDEAEVAEPILLAGMASEVCNHMPVEVAEQMEQQASLFVRSHQKQVGGSRTARAVATRTTNHRETNLNCNWADNSDEPKRRRRAKTELNKAASRTEPMFECQSMDQQRRRRRRHYNQLRQDGTSTTMNNHEEPQFARRNRGQPTVEDEGHGEGVDEEEQRQEQVRIRRTRRVRIKKTKPILGIAIEGGFNVSGQLLPRILFVHEEGAAYRCGKIRASDLILEVNGISTVNMTHEQIAETIATSYYQDPRVYIEFLIGESVVVE